MNRNVVITAIAVSAVAVAILYPRKNEPSGASLVEVKMPQLSGSALEGEQIFSENCAACHGADASGREGLGPPLVHIIYEPNHHGDAAFLIAAKNGVRQHHWPFGNMPPVEGITESQVEKIVAYVRALQEANGIR